MLKFVNYDIVLQEIPDEISLAINISNCPHNCEGCHSPELREDIGEPLVWNKILELYQKYPHITCILLMGGDNDIQELMNIGWHKMLCSYISPTIKLAWYSGLNSIPENYEKDILSIFDYVKIGKYKKELGPLNNSNTNQILYKINKTFERNYFENITYKFWKVDK